MSWREPLGNFQIEGNKIIWEGEGEIACLEPFGVNRFRFRSSKNLRLPQEDWNLLPQPETQIEIHQEGELVTVRNGKLTAEFYLNGSVNYKNDKGEYLLRESWIDKREETVPLRRARNYNHISSEAFETSLYFKADPDEKFYGLGQVPNDNFNLKGCVVELFQKNSHCVIPFLVSSKNYGFLWNNPAIGQVELVNNHTRWYAQATKLIDYVVIGGDNPDEIVCQYAELTGKSPMLPEYAAGFWQCKLRYRTQQELMEVAREYKKRNLPLSVIVIDYFHWTQQGEWKFDPKCWPDPEAMVKELQEMGITLMVSIWPTVDPRCEDYDQMSSNNYLIRSERGNSVFFMFHGPETYYDATHPGARRFVWKKARENYYRYGIKMFWLDEAEPEMRPYSYDNVRYYLGNGLEVSNIYPYYYAKTYYDGLKEAGETEIINLIRCAWVGSQRFGVCVWSGDIASTYESFRKQIKAGLNISLCGIPWWTTDIGGFTGGDPEHEEFRELMARWFAFGVFCPIFRLHGYRLPAMEDLPDDEEGTGAANEVWSFGERNYKILTYYLRMRERLRPYIMKHMKTASETGRPVMRPMFYDFPDDRKCWEQDLQYMFGDDILVAPVCEGGVTEKRVYLPNGERWVYVWDGTLYEGGQEVVVQAPMEIIPLFTREGRELPILEETGDYTWNQ